MQYFVAVINILFDAVRYAQDMEMQLSNKQESLIHNTKSEENKNNANWIFYSVTVSPIQRPKEGLLLVCG